MIFKTKQDLKYFIQSNIPFLLKPSKKSKYPIVYAFSSAHSHEVVVNELTDKLWDKLNN